jgi:hypothetical protein
LAIYFRYESRKEKTEKNTHWNLLLKSGDLDFYFFSFEIWRIWAIFPIKNPFILIEIIYFSGQNLAKKIRQ